MSAARRCLAAVLLSCVVSSLIQTQTAGAWPDTFVGRLEALAMMQTLNAELLASRSATQTLEKWCGDHRLAAAPKVVADLVKGIVKPPTAEQIARLQVSGAAEVKYRHVQLRCGSQVLSEADNWYVPARLTADMNRLLDSTDTPFGMAVRALEPSRQTLAVVMLWSPLPEHWDRPAEAGHYIAQDGVLPSATAGALAIPDALFAHRAVLFTRDHVPFSEVYEVYQRQILAAAPPPIHQE